MLKISVRTIWGGGGGALLWMYRASLAILILHTTASKQGGLYWSTWHCRPMYDIKKNTRGWIAYAFFKKRGAIN